MDAFIGTILPYAGNYAPRGWAFCQGQILNISTYNAVFAILGTTYGGNGSTTFGLPNLQGRVPLGAGQSTGTSNYVLGTSQGIETVGLTVANMPPHTHAAVLNASVPAPVILASAQDATDHAPSATANTIAAPQNVQDIVEIAGFDNEAPTIPLNVGATAATVTGSVTVGVNGAGTPFPVVQPYQVVNFIICLQGLFPPRN